MNVEKIAPEKYYAPILEPKSFQGAEAAFREEAGFNLTPQAVLNGFKEETAELIAELYPTSAKESEFADAKEEFVVDRNNLASEIADHVLYLVGIASFYGLDFDGQDRLAGQNPAEAEEVDLHQTCVDSAQEILEILQGLAIDPMPNPQLKESLTIHYHNLSLLTEKHHLSLNKIVSYKLNRNYQKYAQLKKHLFAENGDFAKARAATKREWNHQEDERYLRGWVVDFATPEDYPEISAMTHLNFDRAESYKDLSDEQKEKYKRANDLEGTQSVCEDENNLAVLLARTNDQEKKIVGYIVLRRLVDDPTLIKVKRFHVHLESASQGIGKQLLAEAEEFLRANNFQTISINASGTSNKWFIRQGYQVVSSKIDTSGVFEGTGDSVMVHEMVKQMGRAAVERKLHE